MEGVWKKLADNIPLSALIAILLDEENLEFEILYSNYFLSKRNGYAYEKVEGKKLREVFPPFYQGNLIVPSKMLEAIKKQESLSYTNWVYVDDIAGAVILDFTLVPLDQQRVAIITKNSNQLDEPEIKVAKQEKEHSRKAIYTSSWLCNEFGEYQFAPTYKDFFGLEFESESNILNEVLEKVDSNFRERLVFFRNQKMPLTQFEMVYRYHHPHKGDIWVREQMIDSWNGTGRISTVQDVSEKINEEVNIKGTNNFFTKLLKTSPDIIYIYNLLEGKNEYSSKFIFEEIGYSPKEVVALGDSFLPSIIHEEDWQMVLDHHSSTLPNLVDEEVAELCYRCIHKNTGASIWLLSIESVFERTKDGRVSKIFGIARNVSVEKEAEIMLLESRDQLQKANDFLQKVVKTSPAVTFIFDPGTCQIQFISENILGYSGYSSNELIKTNENAIRMVVEEDDWELMDDFMQNKLKQLDENQFEKLVFRIRNKDTGKISWFDSKMTIFEEFPGKRSNLIIGVAMDISKEVKSKRIAEEANQELQQFVYSVSHDLRAPVRHIESYAMLIKEEGENKFSKNGQKWLERIIYSARRQASMIDQLLNFSRNRHARLNKADLDVESLIHVIQENTERQYANYPIEWEISRLPSAHVDEALFTQVWENLISNAVKYSIKKDLIKIRIFSQERGEELIFGIQDNGVGFEMEFSEKLFNLFQRFHDNKEFPGHGIGLANVKRIIELHGGQVWAEGEVNVGASFFISIPK
ncbi:MAG: ATP-binding protein [Bacteroidia bacterium]|nr:ATP-binding protein [Bacteroidia bacterium]